VKILALGIGKIGSALLKDLVESHVSEIVAGDLAFQTLRHYVSEMGWQNRVRAERIDVTDHEKLVKLMEDGVDVVASTLISELNVRVAKAAVEAGVGMVDVGGTPPEIFELDRKAKQASVAIVPSCGLDPGIDRILEGHAAKKLDRIEEIYSWCGGFPQKNTPGYNNPLRYKVGWYWRGAVQTNIGKARILRDGRVVEVEKLTGPRNPETIIFPEPVGECEAFFTSAPFDTIEHLALKEVKNAWNKTVRWKGHCDIWAKLIGLGLTSTERVKIGQCEISPLDFFVELGNRMLQYEEGEGDAVVERVQVGGTKGGKKVRLVYELVDFYDNERQVSAMGRTTAYPCSILSQMIGRGEVEERGVIHASKIGCNAEEARRFLDEMSRRGLRITEAVIEPLA